MDTMGRRIKKARQDKKMKQDQLASQLGVGRSVISNWENDVNQPIGDKLIQLCKALDVSLAYILDYYGGQTTRLTPMDGERLRKIHVLDKDGLCAVDAIINVEYERCTRKGSPAPQIVKTRQINVYTMPASAGTGAWLGSDPPEPVTIRLTKASEMADFAVPIAGDSMEPEYHDGDLVLVQRADDLEVGELGLVAVDGEGFFKRIGKNQLESLNPKYKPRKLKDPNIVNVFGRVIGRAEVDDSAADAED